MKYAVLLDFGSTYTKVACVDLDGQEVVLTDKFPSTVHSDAMINLRECFDAARRIMSETEFDEALKLSTSSAAGGLRIAVSGLTRSLSIEAGRNASFGAGGKIMHIASGLMTDDDIRAIEESGAEIVLLCGGYENGNSRQVLHNGEILSRSRIKIPVIYAGNSAVARDIRHMFISRGKECFVAENIIPDVGMLNIGPTVDIIRDLFMHRITDMKGVGGVKSELDGDIIPTPASVLAAGELLYRGTDRSEGIGPYMMADIGGATTDIYSFNENISYDGAKKAGSPEPAAKRTVEGDMGMRESSICLVGERGREKFAGECGITPEELDEAITLRTGHHEYIADSELQQRIDHNIACSAVGISARRHAGRVVKTLSKGCRLVQYGKNLSEVQKVIGTGGIIVNNRDTAAEVLKSVELKESERDDVLLPESVETFIDQDYIFYAAGMLRNYDEEAALAIMKKSIKSI